MDKMLQTYFFPKNFNKINLIWSRVKNHITQVKSNKKQNIIINIIIKTSRLHNKHFFLAKGHPSLHKNCYLNLKEYNSINIKYSNLLMHFERF